MLYVGGDGESTALRDAAAVESITVAADADEAADAVTGDGHDCVVCTDRGDGVAPVDALERVRESDPAVPVLLYVFDGSEALAAAAIDAGVTNYVRADAADEDALVSAVVDAARSYRAEQDVAMLNDLARNVYERITDAFFALDRDWRFTYLNREAEDLLEVTAERIVEENIWEVFPDAVGTPFYREFHRAIATQEPVTFEQSFGPLEKHFEVRAFPSADGLSIHFRQTDDDGAPGREHLLELTGVLSHDLDDSIDAARDALADARARHPEDERLDDVADALDRMDALVAHTITLANEEDYSTPNSTR